MSGSTPTPSAPNNQDTINTYGRVLVSIVIVAAFFVTLGLSLSKTIPNDSITVSLLSTLASLTSAVVYYWVGSSAGSAAHAATIAAMATTAQAANTPTPPTTTTGTTP